MQTIGVAMHHDHLIVLLTIFHKTVITLSITIIILE